MNPTIGTAGATGWHVNVRPPPYTLRRGPDRRRGKKGHVVYTPCRALAIKPKKGRRKVEFGSHLTCLGRDGGRVDRGDVAHLSRVLTRGKKHWIESKEFSRKNREGDISNKPKESVSGPPGRESGEKSGERYVSLTAFF